jgi:hypothetical protein
VSGRIIGVRVINISDYGRGMVLSQELHSTKGWKPAEAHPVSWFNRQPEIGYVGGKKRQPLLAEAGRLMRGRTLVAVQFKGSTRHLQRHGWYRRQLRKAAANA